MKTKITIASTFFTLLCFSFMYSQKTLDSRIQQLFVEKASALNLQNGTLHLYSESKNIDNQIVFGTHNINQPFYTASIGKMITAIAIAILCDEGKLSFNDKIYEYLSEEITENLHVYKNTDFSKQITIANLLQHTSGLPDYFEDATTDNSSNMMQLLFEYPNKIYQPKELIRFAKNKMKPHFAPENGFHYADTNYILLGLIVESASKMSFEESVRQFIFKPLSMHNSYLHLRSEPLQETSSMSDFYVGNTKVSDFRSLTADWAGGALVSTTKDLIKFQKGFLTNVLIREKTRQKIMNFKTESAGFYYGFGIRKVKLQELYPKFLDVSLLGHTGSTGSFLFYCPELDTYITGTLNQTESKKEIFTIINSILKMISK